MLYLLPQQIVIYDSFMKLHTYLKYQLILKELEELIMEQNHQSNLMYQHITFRI